MGEPAYEMIQYELSHDERVREIILDRPEKMNALSGQLLAELEDALGRLEAHERVKLLVLDGNGDAFSAGYDLTPSADKGHETPYDEFRRGGEL